MRNARVLLLFPSLFALGWVVGLGCVHPPAVQVVESVENAAAVAQYKLLLDACRAKGRDAGALAVYEACADEVDAEMCRTKAQRCGGAK
jgi:hypothetical protein